MLVQCEGNLHTRQMQGPFIQMLCDCFSLVLLALLFLGVNTAAQSCVTNSLSPVVNTKTNGAALILAGAF